MKIRLNLPQGNNGNQVEEGLELDPKIIAIIRKIAEAVVLMPYDEKTDDLINTAPLDKIGKRYLLAECCAGCEH